MTDRTGPVFEPEYDGRWLRLVTSFASRLHVPSGQRKARPGMLRCRIGGGLELLLRVALPAAVPVGVSRKLGYMHIAMA